MTPELSPELSIVIGAQQALATIVPCLRALAHADGPPFEIIVVDGSSDATANTVARLFPAVRLERARPELLMPQLWAIGIAQARAPLIALTNAQCIPADDWVPTMLRLAAANPAAVGIGGPIEGPPGGTPLDWALYFARYSAYMPPVVAGPVAEIPGDNALYRRAALDTYWTERGAGFWENLVHRQMRAAQAPIIMEPTMGVTLGGPTRLADAVRLRMRHGRHYGATRPGLAGPRRLAYVAAAPAVAPLLVARVAQRVRAKRPDLQPMLVQALPWLALLAAAWAGGEMRGYLSGRPW